MQTVSEPLPGDLPQVAHRLTRYHDVLEAFRSPALSTLVNDGTEPFRGGTVLRIEGESHHKRRKTLGRLLRGDGDRWFREEVLFPTIRRNLDRVLGDPGHAGPPSVDTVVFARQAFFQLAASLIGLSDVDDGDRADELRQFYAPVQAAMGGWMEGGDREARVRRGLEVKEEFRRRYYEPAYAEHARLAEAVAQGAGSSDDLPHDLLSLITSGADPAWTAEPDLAMRESMTDMLNAGTSSTSATLVWALHETLAWIDAHPDDRALATDATFLSGAVQESLRMHTTLPLFFRTAVENVELSSGTLIHAGELIALEINRANRDTSVFGPDADVYNPRRQVAPGVYPYGVAFGSGRHMCFGLPIVLGSDGVNGSHTQLLKAFFEAGIEPHPTEAPAKKQETMRDTWESYPVVFRGRAR